MTAAPEPRLLSALEIADLERIREKLERLKKLTQLGTPGIRQLRQIFNVDLAEVDAMLERDRRLKRGAKTEGDTNHGHD